MPQDADNFKVKMTPDRRLELWNKKKGLSRKASVIKAAQEGDEKKFIFQVSSDTHYLKCRYQVMILDYKFLIVKSF